MADCNCGRSPTGKCVGWHGLSEQQYQERKSTYEDKQRQKAATDQVVYEEAEPLPPPTSLGEQKWLGPINPSWMSAAINY